MPCLLGYNRDVSSSARGDAAPAATASPTAGGAQPTPTPTAVSQRPRTRPRSAAATVAHRQQAQAQAVDSTTGVEQRQHVRSRLRSRHFSEPSVPFHRAAPFPGALAVPATAAAAAAAAAARSRDASSARPRSAPYTRRRATQQQQQQQYGVQQQSDDNNRARGQDPSGSTVDDRRPLPSASSYAALPRPRTASSSRRGATTRSRSTTILRVPVKGRG